MSAPIINPEWEKATHEIHWISPTIKCGCSLCKAGIPISSVIRPPTSQGAEELHWCNTHQRQANYLDREGHFRCDPSLAGITMPCSVVDLTGKAMIL